MVYALILGSFCMLVGIGALGYSMGRYQASLLDKIEKLADPARGVMAEPVKPTVTGGAYQQPKEISTTPEKKRGAGLVETKTPELLDWENKQEFEKHIQVG